MVFNYIWFFSAYVIARREKVYSIPIFCTLFWFAGDATFVAHYDTWFNTYNHWYVELFWAALLFTVMFEVAYIVQAIQYARKELLPSSSPRQFAALIVAGAVAAVIIWNFINHTMGDPLGDRLLLHREHRATADVCRHPDAAAQQRGNRPGGVVGVPRDDHLLVHRPRTVLRTGVSVVLVLRDVGRVHRRRYRRADRGQAAAQGTP